MTDTNNLVYRLGLSPERVAEMCGRMTPGNRVAFIRGKRSIERERAKLEAAERLEPEVDSFESED